MVTLIMSSFAPVTSANLGSFSTRDSACSMGVMIDDRTIPSCPFQEPVKTKEDDQRYDYDAKEVRALVPPRDEKPDLVNGKLLSSSCWATSAKEDIQGTAGGESSKPAPGQPLLTAAQRQMVQSLNALPTITKHRAFIDPLRNSHATIVARDVKGFPFHKRGWGVLQHWADAFVL